MVGFSPDLCGCGRGRPTAVPWLHDGRANIESVPTAKASGRLRVGSVRLRSNSDLNAEAGNPPCPCVLDSTISFQRALALMSRKKTSKTTEAAVADYRHEAKRKNNLPAGLTAQGPVREVAKVKYAYKGTIWSVYFD